MITNGNRSAVHCSGRFDTAVIPSAQRLDFWNRINTETFSEISVDPRSDSLRGILDRRDRGALKFARVHSTAVVLRGGRSTVSKPGTGGLLLHLQEVGSSLNTQLDRSTVLRVGDISFCDAGRPYMVECREPVQITVMKIPAEMIAPRFGSIDEFAALHVDGTRGIGAILGSLIRNSWLHCSELGSHENGAGEALINAVLDLMALIPRSDAVTSPSASSSSLCREMRAYVRERLADPELSVASLAQAFGVSSRHVHRVFAELETTPSNYILECRLNLAAARLRDDRTDSNITQVAFDSGFGDCTSFSRAFRKRYGTTPREFRRERRTK